MTVEAIIKYIMESPENTNPAILRQMIQQIESGDDSDVMVINLSSHQEDGEFIWEADKVWAEIAAALNEGGAIVRLHVDEAFSQVSGYQSGVYNLYPAQWDGLESAEFDMVTTDAAYWANHVSEDAWEVDYQAIE